MTAPTEYYVDPASGNDTTGDGSSGTPWKTLIKAVQTITPAAAGDRINIKAGTDDVLAANVDIPTDYGAGTAAAPLIIRGYTTTAGDGGIGGIDCNALYDFSPSLNHQYTHFHDMHIHNFGTQTGLIKILNSCTLINCEFDNGTGSGALFNIDNYCQLINCKFHNFVGRADISTGCLVKDCQFITGPTNDFNVYALYVSSIATTITGNIITVTGSADGIQARQGTYIFNNSIYSDGGTGQGISTNQLGGNIYIANNLIEGFSGTGGEGIDLGTHGANGSAIVIGNAVQDCTDDYDDSASRTIYGTLDSASDNENLSATPFTDAANGDFSPVDTGNVKEGSKPGKIGNF